MDCRAAWNESVPAVVALEGSVTDPCEISCSSRARICASSSSDLTVCAFSLYFCRQYSSSAAIWRSG